MIVLSSESSKLERNTSADEYNSHTSSQTVSNSSLPLRLSPPPAHPAIQYRSASTTPPGYAELARPATSIVYTFFPQTVPSNSMVLAPPAYVTSQPSYFISVNVNCFTPTSFITTVRRGSWDGETMGDFEMGLSKKPNTVFLRGKEQPLTEVLESSTRLFRNTWSWKVSENGSSSVLYWEENNSTGGLMCFSSKDKVATNHMAKFIPPTRMRKQGGQPDVTRLEVTPKGHDFLDDIVMSSLIIERLRTTPST